MMKIAAVGGGVKNIIADLHIDWVIARTEDARKMMIFRGMNMSKLLKNRG